jgi:hypothetical protein
MADQVIPDDWTPGVWSHAAVMDMQARLDPVRMARYSDDWQAAVDEIRDVLMELDRRVTLSLQSGWRGQGADAALAALRRYVSGSLEGLVACRSLAVHLGELSRAAGDLRACITAPAGSEFADELLAEALSQVRQLYSSPAVAAGNAVADIPEPPDPFQIGGQAPASALPAGLHTPNPAAGLPSEPGAPPSTPTDLGNGRVGRWAVPTSAAAPDPFWRTPTHSAAYPSSPGDALPARPDPPSSTATPAPAGVPATVPGQSVSVAGRPSSATPVAPLVGTAYPGHFGRDGRPEHRAARYLISAGNTHELIGELPLVAPPVIGE